MELKGLILVVVVISVVLLGACDTTPGPTTTPGPSGQEDTSAVRQPPGDEHPNEFWDEFDWTDLNPAEQTLWQKLGWDEASWEGEAAAPTSEWKSWSELTSE